MRKKKGKGWLTQLSKLSEDIFEKKINKQQWDWRKSYCSFKQNSFKLRDLKKQWILSLSAETTKVDLSHQNVCEFCECNRSRKSRQHLCLNIFVWQVCMIARKSPEHKPWNKNKVWKHVKCFILYYRPIPTNAPHHHFETKQTRFNGWSDFFSIKKKTITQAKGSVLSWKTAWVLLFILFGFSRIPVRLGTVSFWDSCTFSSFFTLKTGTLIRFELFVFKTGDSMCSVLFGSVWNSTWSS